MVDNTDVESLRKGILNIRSESSEYLKRAAETIDRVTREGARLRGNREEWDLITDEEREVALGLIGRIKEISNPIFRAVTASPLLGETDRVDLRIAFRRMTSALHLRLYWWHDAQVVHNEDIVVAVHPARQEERPIHPGDAFEYFGHGCDRVVDILGLVSLAETDLASAIVSTQTRPIGKYRSGSAFIIMWMDKEHRELEDVKNTIKEVFAEFGVNAVRADEIEHSDVITQKILDEIATAEFLIADLTGERPSVYYEVGYAHALLKRPVLYRRKGNSTPLRFVCS
ncbi:MAG: hypothetical protein ACREA0_05860 [bacterium]